MNPADEAREAVQAAFEVILGPSGFAMAVGHPDFQKALQGYAGIVQSSGGAAAFRARMIQRMGQLTKEAAHAGTGGS
jgi:hypothetical protein